MSAATATELKLIEILPEWVREYALEQCRPSERVLALVESGDGIGAILKYQDEVCAKMMGLTDVQYRRQYPRPERLDHFEKRVVYFVARTPRPVVGELVKIGMASNMAARFSALQSSQPETIYLLATIPGGLTVERRLHRVYSHLRERGEWFRVDPELAEFIEEKM